MQEFKQENVDVIVRGYCGDIKINGINIDVINVIYTFYDDNRYFKEVLLHLFIVMMIDYISLIERLICESRIMIILRSIMNYLGNLLLMLEIYLLQILNRYHAVMFLDY